MSSTFFLFNNTSGNPEHKHEELFSVLDNKTLPELPFKIAFAELCHMSGSVAKSVYPYQLQEMMFTLNLLLVFPEYSLGVAPRPSKRGKTPL